MKSPFILMTALAMILAGSVAAERDHLYTTPDPSATGGIQGTVVSPSMSIEQILAIPPDEPGSVYKGTVTGSRRNSFRFEGLPVRKYDLVVIYAEHFYEGLRLQRGENTLTSEDLRKIQNILDASEPYFKKKIVHRAEGTTGRGNLSRAICTFLRDKASAGGHTDHRRTFKLVMFKDVGPGWQIVRARDLYPVSVKPGSPLPRHHYTQTLSGIRVTRSIKDVGDLRLIQ